jgi:hypothetical protein
MVGACARHGIACRYDIGERRARVRGAAQGTLARTWLESSASGPWATAREIWAPVGTARSVQEGQGTAPGRLGADLIQTTLFPTAITRKYEYKFKTSKNKSCR